MNVSFIIGLVTGIALGVYLGTHRKQVVSFCVAFGFIVLLGAFYALAIVGVAWFGGFLYKTLGLAPWQFLAILAAIVALGIAGDRLLRYVEKRSVK
jgi:hypothetical protein